MSTAAMALQAALVEALSEVSGISGVHDGAPARAAFPHITIEDGATADWSHKSGRGRTHRLGATVWDDGLSPERLHQIMATAQAAIEAMPGDLDGHRLVSLIFLGARVLREADGPWRGEIRYRARTLEV